MPPARPVRPVRPCRHLFTGGHQCGSPALRGEELCFYHHSTRRPLKTEVLHGHSTRAVLPEPLDLHAIQRGLAELLRLTAAELIALPLAAQLHRQLSSASQNLARIERSEARADARAQALHLDRAPVTDYTNHPTLGTIAPAPEAQPEVQTAQTEAQTVQTEVQPNEDFETSPKTLAETSAEAGCPTFATVSPSLRWDSTEVREPQEEAGCPTFATVSPSLRWASTETPSPDPLPDPIARFTLPPEPEFLESKAKHDAAYKAYADAYDTLAQGIHRRAQEREDLHHSLFPLKDTRVREQDEEDLEHDPQVAWRVEALQQQQETAA